MINIGWGLEYLNFKANLCYIYHYLVGPEGPMIHIGSMIGAGVSQFQSKSMLNISLFGRS